MIYALDSNIISYMLKGNERVYSHYVSALKHGNPCVLPLIVYYEVLRGLMANDAKKQMSIFENFITAIDIVELSLSDIVTAASIYTYRKKHGTPIEDSDLLIAAQCVTKDYTLVTNNTKHFKGIDEFMRTHSSECVRLPLFKVRLTTHTKRYARKT